MGIVQPGMRLKVKADGYFVPDADGSVYFRSNVGSFRMEGTSIQSWIEKLLPMFDGQHTLRSLTDGLPKPYQDRIYEVAEILYENGFLRDVSTDKPHQLPENILRYYAPQIELVDNLVGSGAYRFQNYRNSNVLAVGAGSMLMSLIVALLESGLASVNMVITDNSSTDKAATIISRTKDFLALNENADNQEVNINPFTSQAPDFEDLRELVRKMDAVLYVSQSGNIDGLRRLESICQHERKLFLPAICINGVGIVTPPAAGTAALHDAPQVASGFEAVWRRIHRPVLERDLRVSGVTGPSTALLANVLVFELFKVMTGIDSSSGSRLYTLNVETLEAGWHDVVPAGCVRSVADVRRIQDIHERLTRESDPPSTSELLSYFTQITDTTAGIFHLWGEGDLPQLPLAQCRVQPLDPKSNGPADLLPEIVCAGFTHEEARYEAGLMGIEAYVERLAGNFASQGSFVGIGAGFTMAEAVGRGLERCLFKTLLHARQEHPAPIRVIQLGEVHDDKCQFYLEALRGVGADPVVGLSDDVAGFPAVWVGVNGRFIGRTGFCLTMALQRALQQTLLRLSRELDADSWQDEIAACVTSAQVAYDQASTPMDIEAWDGLDGDQVAIALETSARHWKDVVIMDLALEPFLNEVLTGVVGISIRQEEVR